MENQMEKKMENEMETLNPFKGYIGMLLPIMENQMEKKMENEMETGISSSSNNSSNSRQEGQLHWISSLVQNSEW